MRFSLFDQWGARNSPPVWHAFRSGLDRLGLCHADHDPDANVAVIWSLVWAGRMRANQEIWRQFRSSGRPVIVLEVGALQRGTTWKVAVNGLGSNALWGQGFQENRPQKLGLDLMPWQQNGQHIVIALQRPDSEQWVGQPAVSSWLSQTVYELQRHTARPIHVRMHPRKSVNIPPSCRLERPRALAGTYDNFDFDQSVRQAWAVINWNSGAAVRAAMLGVPVFVGDSSLAAPVGNLDWSQIENPRMPDRSRWLTELSHTEWTLDEIASGYAIQRLMSTLETF